MHSNYRLAFPVQKSLLIPLKKIEIRITETDWGFQRTESHVISTDRHEQQNGTVMWTRVLFESGQYVALCTSLYLTNSV